MASSQVSYANRPAEWNIGGREIERRPGGVDSLEEFRRGVNRVFGRRRPRREKG
jgi:hypothetical protein